MKTIIKFGGKLGKGFSKVQSTDTIFFQRKSFPTNLTTILASITLLTVQALLTALSLLTLLTSLNWPSWANLTKLTKHSKVTNFAILGNLESIGRQFQPAISALPTSSPTSVISAVSAKSPIPAIRATLESSAKSVIPIALLFQQYLQSRQSRKLQHCLQVR